MSLSDVRSGIKQALDLVDGLRTYDYQADEPVLPAAVVRMPDQIDPHAVLGIGADYTIAVTVMVSLSSDRGGDQQLEDLLALSGSGSIVAAIDNDPTLGGACDSADVTSVTNFGYGVIGTVQVMRCDVMISVMA